MRSSITDSGVEVIYPTQVPRLKREYRTVNSEIASRMEARANTTSEFDTSTDYTFSPQNISSFHSPFNSLNPHLVVSTPDQSKVRFQEPHSLRHGNLGMFDNPVAVAMPPYQNKEFFRFLQTMAKDLEIEFSENCEKDIIEKVCDLKRSLKSNQFQASKYSEECRDLQERLNIKQVENAKLQQQVDQSANEARKTLSDLLACKKDCETIEAESLKKMESQEKLIGKLESELAKVTKREAQLAKENQTQTAISNEIQSLSKTHETTLSKKKQLETDLLNLQEKQKNLVKENQDLKALISSNEKELQQLRKLAEAAKDSTEEKKQLEKKIAFTKSKYLKKMKNVENESTKIIHQLYVEIKILKNIIELHVDNSNLASNELTSPIEEIKLELDKRLFTSPESDSNVLYLRQLYENRYINALNESKELLDSNRINETMIVNLFKLSIGYFEKLIPRHEKNSYFNLLVKELHNRKILSKNDLNLINKLVETFDYLFGEVNSKMTEVEKRAIPNL
ncbi:hypothetical protein KGF56_000268 [Candida oxycetoniae]|uniref:Uncharacterized protein n=1 Tax=Candida oxycetoniae TaxID=497107 RepID=A0AAI9T2G4_9ASCO|nr:uncharacterized protein KGF56_000268 [Candida oxycetoniae]KAI3406975.2 hypothetical protein KGF56_000268 [Candida oxycetoniae]